MKFRVGQIWIDNNTGSQCEISYINGNDCKYHWISPGGSKREFAVEKRHIQEWIDDCKAKLIYQPLVGSNKLWRKLND